MKLFIGRPRLVVSHSTCPPLSSPPHANSFVIGPAVIKHTQSNSIPPYLRTTKSIPSRQLTVSDTTANLAEDPPRSPAPVSTGGRSGVRRSSDGHNEHSRIVLPPETGEQPSLSSGLSDAPWLNGRRPGSLYSIIEYEYPPPPLPPPPPLCSPFTI
jgi:hypothetical protein